ncbi:MAG: hypothetical protein K9M03_03530 [Kiritimatiellales bacterium]|nr:hypothetical protein [Kiritimatiellales bacterium]
MKTFLRALGIVTVALIIASTILLVLISATNTITVIDSIPADFLPENNTVALFSNVDEATLRKFEAIFPELSKVTPHESKTIALLTIDEELLLAEFSEIEISQKDENTFGRFSVSATDQRATEMLKTSTTRLSSSYSYNQLAQEDPWVFINLSVLPDPKTFSEIMLNAMIPTGSTHASLSFENDQTQISFVGGTPLPIISLAPTIKSTFSGSVLTLRISNASHIWSKLMQSLTDTDKGFLVGSAGRIIEETFSPSVSLTYDILPMLTGPTTIHLGKNGSGKTVLALEGIDENASALADHIKTLHEGFKSVIPSAVIKKRTLDERFSATDIRIDKSSVKSETTQYGNWTMLITKTNDGREFATATLGATFAMANSVSALQQIMEKNVEVITPSNPSLRVSKRIADGAVSLESASSLIKDAFPSLKSESLPPILSNLSGFILWSVEQQGQVTHLTIE